jgi:hypothetical protein
MIVKLCFSLLISLSIGFIFIQTFLPLKKDFSAQFLLKISLAVGLGFGITSCVYFLTLLAIGPRINGIFISEATVLFFLACMFVYNSKPFRTSEYDGNHEKTLYDIKLRRILSVCFYSVLILAFVNIVYASMLMPGGTWDAWAIWNMRARFIFRAGEFWRDAFSSLIFSKFHSDYPLLISLSVSRCWTYVGKELAEAPMLISLFIPVAIVGLLYSATAMLRSKSQGMLAGIALLSTPLFMLQATQQLADIPIAFFFLASIVFLFYQERYPGYYGFSSFSGIMAAFSGWTKNEGLLFLISVILAGIVVTYFSHDRKRHMKQVMYFVLGSMPVIAIIIYFKVYLAPQNDIKSGMNVVEILERTGDITRYIETLKAFLLGIVLNFPHIFLLFLYLLYSNVKINDNRKISVFTSLLVLTFMLLGYYWIYLITPYDLSWHLEWSLDRLLIQLWPSVLFTFFMIVRTPEEVLLDRPI